MGDLLKEAIADAKAVRETALANAKMALEEAFTPQLKSMLSAKLKEDEFEDEEEIGGEEEFGGEEEIPAEEPVVDGGEENPFAEEEPEVDESNIIEIDGVKYAPVVSEDEYGEEEMGGEEELDIEDDQLDLESIIRELETEINEEDDAYDEKVGSTDASHLAEEDDAYDENVEGKEKPEHVGGTIGEGEEEGDEELEIDESVFTEGEDEDEEEIEEQSDSSNIGAGDNKVDVADSGDYSGEDDSGSSTEVKALGEQLKEYKQAVKFLKDKLHEVNILNAKLLFTNKLFKEFALDNGQKLKVVETFDRAQTTREIKLVYSTLCEQFGDNGSINKRNSINESASVKSGSTKPSNESKKVITEESGVANRFKKLAGLV